MRRLLTSTVLLATLTVAGCSSWFTLSAPVLDDFGPVGDFSLTERSGRTVTQNDLLGKVWVASFVFTRCCTGCPLISESMAQLQRDLADQNEVILVSFTVDPDHDKPDVLNAYADSMGADPRRWLFLTGKQEDVYRVIRESFQLAVQQNEGQARTPGNEVTHSNRLILVDRRGRIRGRDFDGTKADDVPRLLQAITALLQEQP